MSAPSAAAHDAAPYVIEDDTLERVHEALNHAVRSRAENPLLHMARVLRSGRQAQLAVESRARAKQEAEAAAQGSGDGEEAGASAQGAALVTVVPLTVEELEGVLRAAGIDIAQWGTGNAKATSHLLGEIRAHESVLCRPPGGGGAREAVRRVVHTVVVEFRFRGRVLVETHHELDGRTRQRFELLSGKVRWHSGEGWQQAARRAIGSALSLDITTFTLHEESCVTESGTYPSRAYPGLLCQRTRYRVQATLLERAACAAGAAEEPSLSAGVLRLVSADRCTTTEPGRSSHDTGQRSGLSRQKHHWAWYLPREWATVQRKRQLEQQPPESVGALSGDPASAPDGHRPCADVRFDGVGDETLHDDDLGPAATQLRLLGLLYRGCRTLWYHFVHSGLSRAKILHVQGIDHAGSWQDPTICKLSPTELLRAEADAHATFARYIGESVPQRIGEPIFLDEIGGMVLELVGACWRMPELAHTQTHLSNTFAEVCKYDSDHAAEGVPAAGIHGGAAPGESDGEAVVRDRPVFGEVRIVTDEVFLGQLHTVVMQSAHREPRASLVEHYGLPGKLARVLAHASTPTQADPGGSPSGAYAMTDGTRAALRSLQAALVEDDGDYVGPAGYGGPWFGIVHGDLHGGNIMVDSRSYAWLIDYGEVEDAHVFKDPAKLEACIWYIHTTMPVPPSSLRGASAHEVKWWLSIRAEVAEQLVALADASTDPVLDLTMERLPALLRAACAAAGEVGVRVDVDEVALRFASEDECEEYLSQARRMMELLLPCDIRLHPPSHMVAASVTYGYRLHHIRLQARRMMELLLPFRALDAPVPYNFVPAFLTKERLRLCWEHVSQIRGLLPQSYCRPHAQDRHPFDAHPMQYGVALFYFTLKMRFQYREPNPWSRRLAAYALEQLAGYLCTWLKGGAVQPSAATASLVGAMPASHRPARLAYAHGQRLCFIDSGDSWREGVVLRPPRTDNPCHRLALCVGPAVREVEVDLDLRSHTAVPLYAYDVGHPIELLARPGHPQPYP